MPAVGEVKTNPANPAQQARWDGRQWVDASAGQLGPGGIPAGATARPDYGPGVYQSNDGAVLARGAKGGLQMLQGAQMATGDAKTRINLAIDPAVEAQGTMARSEQQGTPDALNPLNRDWGATLLLGSKDEGKAGDAIAKAWGGQDFQDYEQAAKTFESSVIPIFSGAAVTPSEASRFIKANLPEFGDTARTLANKARNRAMILNAAAALTGKPKPFPEVPTWQERRLMGSPPSTGAPAAPSSSRAPIPPAAMKTFQHPGWDRSKPVGSRLHPYLARDEATLDRLPKGSWAIGPDGQYGQVE